MPITVRRWEDPSSWNDFVSSVPHAHFQQSWEWGAFAPCLGGKAVRVAAVEGETVRGAMQIFVNPLSRTRRTQLYVPRGPALSTPAAEILGPLLDGARALGFEERALGLKIESNAPACHAEWEYNLRVLSLKPSYPPTQPRSSWLLDISADPDSILAGMKQKTRYNIRLGSKRGVEVREGSAADLEEFYALYRETAARDGFHIHPLPLYRNMFGLFWDSGRFCLLLARFHGKLIGAVTLLRFGATCWYLQGASSGEHRNLMATYVLQWEAIRWAREAGCTLYDFRAVPDILDEGQDMYGVYRFKEGFGGYHYTTLPTYVTPYRLGAFGLWQAFFAGRFAADAWRRRRRGMPARQFA
jgi:peptidoglycan pentaglycine glycine transferase (the first glycine)